MSDTPQSPDAPAGEITLLLQQIEGGDSSAAERILPLVYDELRKVAAAKMARESAGQTLQPTALVHEAWLRLGGEAQPEWKQQWFFAGLTVEQAAEVLGISARTAHRDWLYARAWLTNEIERLRS